MAIINIWLLASFRALFILGLGYFLIEFAGGQLSWTVIAALSVVAFFYQIFFSTRKQSKESRK
ncbi:VanZ family protein [Alkalicoccobacillus murimartini]|uniref:VanZ family protein n=1 Tax=Alkalicoccobacillus murimartini TaxID=171685 RepID=A0ABT9YD92_9BACI|nr:VanZ family protein [Alkalicoccobacillus murimartini]